MTSDELRARVERFLVEECKGRWPAVSLIESLCWEMVAEGLTMAAMKEASCREFGDGDDFV